MFESCYTPVDVAYRMRVRYGFPVEMAGCRPSLVCGRIGAIDMSAALGRHVLSLLGSEQSLPVVGNSRDTAWTFLVDASWPLAPLGSRQRRLTDHGVTVRPRGRRVLLPLSMSGPGHRWVSEPEPGALRLPSRTTVLDAVDLAIDMTTEDSRRPARR